MAVRPVSIDVQITTDASGTGWGCNMHETYSSRILEHSYVPPVLKPQRDDGYPLSLTVIQAPNQGQVCLGALRQRVCGSICELQGRAISGPRYFGKGHLGGSFTQPCDNYGETFSRTTQRSGGLLVQTTASL